MQPPPTVIVLAAGLGSRFLGAQHKLLQPIRDDDGRPTPMLALTLRHAIESRMPVLVVTTAELAPLAGEQVAARDIVLMPAAAPIQGRGMGDSIAAGVVARADASGWVVLPADMPRVRPVGFDAELYSELIALTGDEGARRIVARYPAQAVDVDDPGVLIDIDTIEDLAERRDPTGDFQPSAFAPPLY